MRNDLQKKVTAFGISFGMILSSFVVPAFADETEAADYLAIEDSTFDAVEDVASFNEDTYTLDDETEEGALFDDAGSYDEIVPDGILQSSDDCCPAD